MYLLYVDMSGMVGRQDETHLVMSGVAIAENAIHHVITELDELVAKKTDVADDRTMELHGSPMWSGRGQWRKVEKSTRMELVETALRTVNGQSRHNIRLFGAAVDKRAVSPQDPVEHGYEQLANRFDKFLSRLNRRKRAPKQRGLVIVDKSRYEDALQSMANQHRSGGTSWGRLHNLSEVPLFIDSRASRLVQLADLVSYALWRRYEFADVSLITTIIERFDREGGIYHGLYHKTPDRNSCDCAACASRR